MRKAAGWQWDVGVRPGSGSLVGGCACGGLWGAEEPLLRGLSSPCPCRSRDFYHTCYCLSGLSIAQHFGSGAMLHDVVLGVPENALVRQDGGCDTSSPQGPQDGAYQESRAAALAVQNPLRISCVRACGHTVPPDPPGFTPSRRSL